MSNKAHRLECLDVRMLGFGASIGPPEHCSPTVRRHEGLGQHVLEYGATVPDSAPHDCGSPGLSIHVQDLIPTCHLYGVENDCPHQ